MSDFRGLYGIRDIKEEDKSFILATFLRGLYYGNSWFSLIPKDIFMNNYKVIAQALLDSPNTTTKIACLKEDENVILGYSILSSDFQTVHWVYCKAAWRKKGIGKSLTPQYATFASHLTELGQELMKKYKDMNFNPFSIR